MVAVAEHAAPLLEPSAVADSYKFVVVSVAVAESAVCAVAADTSAAQQYPEVAVHCPDAFLGESGVTLDVLAVFLDVSSCPGVLAAY